MCANICANIGPVPTATLPADGSTGSITTINPTTTISLTTTPTDNVDSDLSSNNIVATPVLVDSTSGQLNSTDGITTTRQIDADATGSDDNEDGGSDENEDGGSDDNKGGGSMMGFIIAVVVLAVCGVVAGVALSWRLHWRNSKDAVLRRHTLNRSQRHVDNPGFQPDKELPATPGYVEDSSSHANQGCMDYATPLDTDPTCATSVDDTGYGAPHTTASADPTHSQPLDLETGSGHYAATPLTTADGAAGGAHYAATPLTTADGATSSARYADTPLTTSDRATGSAYYAATPLTTADGETNIALYGAPLTTAGSIYSVPLDAHSANDSQA